MAMFQMQRQQGMPYRLVVAHGEGPLQVGKETLLAVVPDGSAYTMWGRPGVELPQVVAAAVAKGGEERLATSPLAELLTGYRTFLPGSRVPNFVVGGSQKLDMPVGALVPDEGTSLSSLMYNDSGLLEGVFCLGKQSWLDYVDFDAFIQALQRAPGGLPLGR